MINTVDVEKGDNYFINAASEDQKISTSAHFPNLDIIAMTDV